MDDYGRSGASSFVANNVEEFFHENESCFWIYVSRQSESDGASYIYSAVAMNFVEQSLSILAFKNVLTHV